MRLAGGQLYDIIIDITIDFYLQIKSSTSNNPKLVSFPKTKGNYAKTSIKQVSCGIIMW